MAFIVKYMIHRQGTGGMNDMREIEKHAGRGNMNCTPFVRQYDILNNKWGDFYAKRSTK